jgi:glycosidase
MFGEAFDGDDKLLGSYTQAGMLDSVFYFSQHYQVFHDVFEMAHDPTQQKGTDQIKNLWDQKPVNYGNAPQPGGIGVAPSKALVNFMDNHDVERFLFAALGDKDALRNALTLLMTEDGIPCLYYGTEQDFSGGNDPSNREVLWPTGYDTNGDTFRHFARLAAIRSSDSPPGLALRRGDTKVVWSSPHVATEDDAGIFAFERSGGDAQGQYALVIFNTNAKKDSVTADGMNTMTISQKGLFLTDVLDPAQKRYSVDAAGTLRVTVPKQSAMILTIQ